MKTGAWRTLRLARLGHFIPGCAFPHEYQGTEDAEIPFLKVGDMGLPENGREIARWNNSVSRGTACQLGARIAPSRSIVFAKVGAALLSNRRRLLTRPSIFDNNMMGFVCRRDAVPEFLNYALSRVDFALLVNPGPVPSINEGDLREVELPIPDVDLQRSIAEFLDRKTAAIDVLVEKKERLIAAAEERRAALISDVVLGALSPAKRRDSGTCLGTLPEHWAAKRLMYLTAPGRPIMYGIVLPGPNVDDGVPIIKSGNCTRETLRSELLHRTTFEIEAGYERSRVAKDDIVYAIRGSVGMAALVPGDVAGANLTQDAARIAPALTFNPRWLLYAVQSAPVWAQLAAGIVGATVKGINIRDLKRPFVPVPPRHEQDEIAAHLDTELGKLHNLEDATAHSIETLREYRQALIAAAVTGQLDVAAEEAA